LPQNVCVSWVALATTSSYGLLLGLVGLKALHTALVIWWLLRNGNGVAQSAGEIGPSVDDNVRRFHDAMVAHGAAAPRHLLRFGIKDTVLTDRLAASRGLTRAFLTIVRVVWHAGGLTILSVTALFVGAYLPRRLPEIDSVLLFGIGELMITIMFLIGVEMVVLMITMGRWLPYYHRLIPTRLIAANTSRVRETISLIVACGGSAIMTLAAMTGMLAFASRRTDAAPPAISDDLAVGIVQAVAKAIKVLGTVGDGLASDTFTGAILTVTLLPLVLSYIAFIVPIAASVVEAGRNSPVDDQPHVPPVRSAERDRRQHGVLALVVSLAAAVSLLTPLVQYGRRVRRPDPRASRPGMSARNPQQRASSQK
jgi:hypothetical protein